MSEDSQILSCVMIPLKGRQLLLPNVSIAEVVDHIDTIADDDAPQWLAGQLQWRGQQLPVISYEGANGGERVLRGASRGGIVILNTIGPDHRRLPFLALLTQGIPSQARLEPDQVQASDGDGGPADLMVVNVEGETVYIPNLEYLESLAVQAIG